MGIPTPMHTSTKNKDVSLINRRHFNCTVALHEESKAIAATAVATVSNIFAACARTLLMPVQ